MYLKDSYYQLYLIVSGACVSCIPPRKEDLKYKSTGNLWAANGTPIPSYGTRVIELSSEHVQTGAVHFILCSNLINHGGL